MLDQYTGLFLYWTEANVLVYICYTIAYVTDMMAHETSEAVKHYFTISYARLILGKLQPPCSTMWTYYDYDWQAIFFRAQLPLK